MRSLLRIRVRNINGSHWLQQDCADEVNREMRGFLDCSISYFLFYLVEGQ